MSCTNTQNNIEFYKGNDINMKLTFTDCDTGDPLNLGGSTVYFTVKKKFSDTEKIIDKAITTHTSEAEWKTELILTGEETTVEPWNYVFDFQLLDASSKKTTILSWNLSIKNVVRIWL